MTKPYDPYYHDLSFLKEEVIESMRAMTYKDILRGVPVTEENKPFYILYKEEGFEEDPEMPYAPVSVEGYEKIKSWGWEVQTLCRVNTID